MNCTLQSNTNIHFGQKCAKRQS